MGVGSPSGEAREICREFYTNRLPKHKICMAKNIPGNTRNLILQRSQDLLHIRMEISNICGHNPNGYPIQPNTALPFKINAF